MLGLQQMLHAPVMGTDHLDMQCTLVSPSVMEYSPTGTHLLAQVVVLFVQKSTDTEHFPSVVFMKQSGSETWSPCISVIA